MDHKVRSALKMIAFILTAIAFVVFAWIVLEFIVLRGSTPPIKDENGQSLPRSIASLEQIRIGGVDQYVLIRGADSTNPVLLFLHGGPGMPAMYLAHSFQHDLERDFVVVHWDRRGAGKSYEAGLKSDSLTVRQTLTDTYQLTRLLLNRFGKERLFLFAHSWGTLLGMLAAREHPEYYSAYIGTGQLSADSLRRYIIQRRFLFNMARGHGDLDLMDRLIREGNIREDDLFRYGAELRGSRSFMPILMTGLQAPEYDLFDALNVPRGASMVSKRMKEDIPMTSFENDLARFAIPVYFLLGRHDYTTPSLLAAEYFTVIEAPVKRLFWFEYSAHFPFWEEPRRFTEELRTIQAEVQTFWDNRSGPQPPEIN